MVYFNSQESPFTLSMRDPMSVNTNHGVFQPAEHHKPKMHCVQIQKKVQCQIKHPTKLTNTVRHPVLYTEKSTPLCYISAWAIAGGHSPSYPQKRLDLAAALDPPWGSSCLCVGGCVWECHSSRRDPSCPTTPPDSPTFTHFCAPLLGTSASDSCVCRSTIWLIVVSLPSFASSFPVGLHSCRYGLVSRSPLLNLIHLPSIPPSILPDTSLQAKTTFLVGCSLFIFLCLLLAFLSFPSRFFTPIINSVVLSCALFHWSPSSFCSTCSLADCLFCPDALRMSCTPSVFFPFSLPKSPSTPSFYQKHKLQNSVLLRLPRHDGPLALATYFCNTCGTNTAATRLN